MRPERKEHRCIKRRVARRLSPSSRKRLPTSPGGYSGTPIKPIALRCVWEVSQAIPGLPIIGSGGVSNGDDVVEFFLAGASAVDVGTAHFANPQIGNRIIAQLRRYMKRHGVNDVTELIGAAEPW